MTKTRRPARPPRDRGTQRDSSADERGNTQSARNADPPGKCAKGWSTHQAASQKAYGMHRHHPATHFFRGPRLQCADDRDTEQAGAHPV